MSRGCNDQLKCLIGHMCLDRLELFRHIEMENWRIKNVGYRGGGEKGESGLFLYAIGIDFVLNCSSAHPQFACCFGKSVTCSI